MDTKSLIIGVIMGLILGLVASPFMFGYRVPGMMGGRMMGGMDIDRHFIEQMIPHHEEAIAMAQTALERSKRPEVLSLAGGIIEAQEQENADMREWYQEWFGENVSSTSRGMMDGRGMAHMDSMEGDLEALRAAEDFDREFVRQMIRHHETAIMMAQMLQWSTERPEMRALADQIITSQTREIEIMRAWTKEWE